MEFLWAFLIGGLICLVAQVVYKLKPKPIPILTVALCLGGLLSALGVMGALSSVGGAGVGVMILSCGDAIVGTFIGLMAGDASGFIILAALILVACLVMGLGGGAIGYVIDKRKGSQ